MENDYTTQKLSERIALKAFVSSSSSLTPQQILDLCNDSLRSYIVPLINSLREEFWVGKEDIALVTDANGAVTVPDSFASTLRTVAWNNGGVITPLTRIEPENSFQYLAVQGSLPLGFELRGYTLVVLPKVAGISLRLTAVLRPPQMVSVDDAARITGLSAGNYLMQSVPLAWQAAAPTTLDVVSSVSPFSVVQSGVAVASFDATLKRITFTALTADAITALTAGNAWIADVGGSPFANVPVELYPLLETDVVATLYQALGDKRLKGILDRKKELEGLVKRSMGPRTQGNSRPIVNASAPGMRSWRR